MSKSATFNSNFKKSKPILNTLRTFNKMRDSYGPDFDDRLIRLVRDNPAIYDVNHEHYRRFQVRVAIWERISNELRTPSKFLQTKWKNIRYNYLQELKSLETGLANANIRKRRFTEDLSFLQNTAQIYRKGLFMNSYNSSDNDSNSYLYTDPQNNSTYEIIEIEHSDDDTTATAMEYDAKDYNIDVPMQISQANEHKHLPTEANNECYGDDQILTELTNPPKTEKSKEPQHRVTIEQNTKFTPPRKAFVTPVDSPNRHATMTPPSPTQSKTSSPSPLFTPIVVMGNDQKAASNGEVSFKSIPKLTTAATTTIQRRQISNIEVDKATPSDIITNATKRKSMPAPFPVLTPINDPIELYCLSLVDSLRNMPRVERERVKFEFAKILKDAKYKDQS